MLLPPEPVQQSAAAGVVGGYGLLGKGVTQLIGWVQGRHRMRVKTVHTGQERVQGVQGGVGCWARACDPTNEVGARGVGYAPSWIASMHHIHSRTCFDRHPLVKP